jgi:uncharacterized protein YxjI
VKYLVQEKFFRLGQDNDILTEAGQPVLRVDGKALSLNNLMIVNDLSGNEVARVSRKIIALLSTYEIALAGGVTAEAHHQFSPLHPKWTISIPGGADLEMTGNLANHDFTIAQNGQTIATISKAWMSMSDTYGVDITEGQNDLLILCIVLSLEAEQDRDRRHA